MSKKAKKLFVFLTNNVLNYHQLNKKDFIRQGKAVLKEMGKELGLKDVKIGHIEGGIAVSGEVSLKGMWNENEGVYINICPDMGKDRYIMYRAMKHMGDTSGHNKWCSHFELNRLDELINKIKEYKGRA